MTLTLSDSEFEATALQHWLDRVPELDEISISVRSDGELLRFVLLRPGTEAVTLNSDECHPVPAIA